MGAPLQLSVRIVPSRTCFVSVPRQLAETLRPLPDGSFPALRLAWPAEHTGGERTYSGEREACVGEHEAYVGWNGTICPADQLHLPASLAEALRLRRGARVAVAVASLPRASTAVVHAVGEADWEMAAAATGDLEGNFLTQLRYNPQHPFFATCGDPFLPCVRNRIRLVGSSPSDRICRSG